MGSCERLPRCGLPHSRLMLLSASMYQSRLRTTNAPPCLPTCVSAPAGSKSSTMGARSGPTGKPVVIEPLPGFKDVPVSERQVRENGRFFAHALFHWRRCYTWFRNKRPMLEFPHCQEQYHHCSLQPRRRLSLLDSPTRLLWARHSSGSLYQETTVVLLSDGLH